MTSMNRVSLLALLAALPLAACSSSSSTPEAAASGGASATAGAGGTGGDGVGGTGGGGGAGGGAPTEIRGQRYCEILVANIMGTQLHVDVYNTFGLNDCPADAWSKVDAAKVMADAGATQIILNGPRYWMLDSFDSAMLVDPTVKPLGGIDMRLAGKIDLPLAQAMALGKKPYTATTVQRNTTVRFDAGKPVYELVGPDGAAYAMQSYSTQLVAQTEADLPGLGQKLMLPAGWMFRVRMLTSPLTITALGGMATVVQDDNGDTYQMENPLAAPRRPEDSQEARKTGRTLRRFTSSCESISVFAVPEAARWIHGKNER
jgi:hypothetical protein